MFLDAGETVATAVSAALGGGEGGIERIHASLYLFLRLMNSTSGYGSSCFHFFPPESQGVKDKISKITTSFRLCIECLGFCRFLS